MVASRQPGTTITPSSWSCRDWGSLTEKLYGEDVQPFGRGWRRGRHAVEIDFGEDGHRQPGRSNPTPRDGSVRR